MIRHFVSRQFLGFVAVGLCAAAANWLARLLFAHWLPFAGAVALAYAVGLGLAFVLNSRYVFPASTRPRAAQAREFVLVNLGFFPLVWLASLAFAQALQALGLERGREGLAHAAALALPMLATFLIYKFHTFRGS